ncbi:MAG: WD40 repeat domain-containing protein [Candidatus Kapabacteria bacterium]|nr:WD40 repeat domain-containing protein [Candidatus Kapabacteria bacterium]
MKRILSVAVTVLLTICAAHAQDTVLTLVAPKSGITFYTTRDTIIDVRWSGVEDTVAVQLDFTTDGGRKWTMIKDSAKGLSYPWNVTALSPASTYQVRVSQLRPPGVQDQVKYTGHTSDVVDAWWNPANTRVVSVADRAHIWDASVSSSAPLVSLPTGRAQYTTVRWSGDSSLIVAGSDDGRVQIVDVATTTSLSTLDLVDPVGKVEMDPTGSWLFTRIDGSRLPIHRLKPAIQPGSTLFIGSITLDMALNADGSRVVVCADNDARVYSRLGGLPATFRGHSGGVLSAAFSPDGTRVCSIGGDLTVRMWNSASGVEIWKTSDGREGVRSVAFSPDGALVAVGYADSSIKVFRADSGIVVQKFGDFSDDVRMVQFSPDGTLLAGASDDNFARVYDLTTGELKAAYQHDDNVRVARWSNAGDRLLTSSNDGTARIWQVRSIVLQSDTTGQFTIAPPPPAFVRLVASGDTLQIEETTTLSVRTTSPQFLGLAEIDSLRIRLVYDPTMLFRTSSSVPLTVIDDVVGGRNIQYLVCTLPLDTVAQELFTVSFQATLGQDSVTYLKFDRVEPIGNGPGARIDTFSDPVLVRGICRVGDGPRMFNPIGSPLSIISRSHPDGVMLDCVLGESATATLSVYDVRGELLWRDRSTADEERSRRLVRIVPSHLLTGVGLVTIATPTQSASTVIMEGKQP